MSLLFVYCQKTLDSRESKEIRLSQNLFCEKLWIHLDGFQSNLHVPEGGMTLNKDLFSLRPIQHNMVYLSLMGTMSLPKILFIPLP